MVSFQCDGCADTVKKPQLDKHKQRCWASFTCLDCSTTFQNQDYKNHTSCISEAEKYQGALYKGAKKSQTNTPVPAVASTSASASPAPSGVGTSIHPSRLNQLQSTSGPTYDSPIQSYPARGGGRFARGGARGGYGAQSRGGGGTTKYSATGENRNAPEGGMRSWGSNANSETGAEGDVNLTTQASASSWGPTVPDVNGGGEVGKKNKKKGDKKGTGSRANTRNPPKTSINGDDSTFQAPPVPSQPQAAPIATKPTLPTPEVPETSEKSSKKRKLEPLSPAPTTLESTSSVAVSEKTLKRLRKNLTKLVDKSTSSSIPLSEWLTQAGKHKEKTIEVDEVIRGLKVSLVDGRWQLDV